MKEFNCKISSAWSNDDRTKDASCTHRKYGDGGQGTLSLLDHGGTTTYICNEGKLWDSWDQYPIYARIQEGRESDAFFTEEERKMVWMAA